MMCQGNKKPDGSTNVDRRALNEQRMRVKLVVKYPTGSKISSCSNGDDRNHAGWR
jgi:hypothetical protein